jgi:hypothetical protein
MRRCVRILCLAAICLLARAAPTLADDTSSVFARVQAAVDAWNKGGSAAASAYFRPTLTIVDNTPPYLFRGPHAMDDWAKAYSHDGPVGHDLTKATLHLLTWQTVEVSAQQAYVAVPAAWKIEVNGNIVVSHGVITVVLEKIDSEWWIAAWIWTPC